MAAPRQERKPDWLKVRLAQGRNYKHLKRLVHERGLHTVCEEALCPNMGTCWEHGRATLMILGDVCSRGCRFCAVGSGKPGRPDTKEPGQVADAVKAMGLRDVVITSVTRDDLEDGGATLWAETIRLVHEAVRGIRVEVLIPDFGGDRKALQTVFDAKPEVLGHNLETVPALYARARPNADYRQSLNVLRRAHDQGLITKTGIMVGVGETREQVVSVMKEAVAAGCDIFYAGQYLQPTRGHLPVDRYVEPGEFDFFTKKGLELGFQVVVAGPLVRSSYHSEEQERFVGRRCNTGQP